MLDHLYLVENLLNSKIAETKALEPLKSWHFCNVRGNQTFFNLWATWTRLIVLDQK